MTEYVQLKVRVRAEQRDRLDELHAERGMTPSALVRAALDHYFETLPPALVGDGLLADALAALDRATIQP